MRARTLLASAAAAVLVAGGATAALAASTDSGPRSSGPPRAQAPIARDLAQVSLGHHHRDDGLVAHVRRQTRPLTSVATAQRRGYALLKDAAGIACIDDPMGGMGIHYVNSTLVGDATLRPGQPEAAVYEPVRHGLRLAALEYIVFQDAWQKAHGDRTPRLFGRPLTLVPAGNRYGLPPFYEIHLWAWKQNPSGLFNDWNPRVVCPGSSTTAGMSGMTPPVSRVESHEPPWVEDPDYRF